jgi:hypothetical protein
MKTLKEECEKLVLSPVELDINMEDGIRSNLCRICTKVEDSFPDFNQKDSAVRIVKYWRRHKAEMFKLQISLLKHLVTNAEFSTKKDLVNFYNESVLKIMYIVQH